MNEKEQAVLDDLRQQIDRAKANAKTLDAAPQPVELGPGVTIHAPRKRQRPEKPEPVDPSNVKVASDPVLTAALVSTLIDVRAQQRALEAQDVVLKELLVAQIGELEYLALGEGEAPIVSLRHDQSIRIASAAVKEAFPPETHPDLYQTVVSRPLRLL